MCSGGAKNQFWRQFQERLEARETCTHVRTRDVFLFGGSGSVATFLDREGARRILARLFILGIGKELGHAKAADWVVRLIQDSIRHRALTPPTPLLPPLGAIPAPGTCILDPASPRERARVDSGQEMGPPISR